MIVQRQSALPWLNWMYSNTILHSGTTRHDLIILFIRDIIVLTIKNMHHIEGQAQLRRESSLDTHVTDDR